MLERIKAWLPDTARESPRGVNMRRKKRITTAKKTMDAFLVHLQTGFLEGYELAGLLVFGFVDFSIGTFSYLLQFLVLVFHGGLLNESGWEMRGMI